jgi:outer membrane protein TolC
MVLPLARGIGFDSESCVSCFLTEAVAGRLRSQRDLGANTRNYLLCHVDWQYENFRICFPRWLVTTSPVGSRAVRKGFSQIGNRRGACVLILVLVWIVPTGFAQALTRELAVQMPDASAQGNAAPLTLTMQDALQRARRNDPQYRAALTDLGLARQDRVQARAGLLPSLSYNNSFIYTQGTGTPALAASKYIANNGVHEYLSQADAHQSISLTVVADYRRSLAALAQSRAKAEIATRGLVVTVTQAYYGLVVAQRKYATAQRAAKEASQFLGISQKLENGGEVAHADVIKARIQSQQRERDLQEAQLDMDRTRLDLAVLLFSDFNQDFSVVDDLQAPEPLPAFTEIEASGKKNNPELAAALAALEVANHQVTAAWGGLLPSLSIDYFYGIDSNRFALRTDGVRNIGYSTIASLQIPIFNWGADRSKLKQAELRREQARVELSFAQRQLLSHLRQFFNEAETVRSELESLNSSAEIAAESMRLTTMRYQAGESTVLEVVDAQNTMTQARNAYDDGQARYRVALATLQTLTGTF